MSALDHADEARQFLYQSQMTQAGPDVAQYLATHAQAHATLALVEQQRIANDLAFIQFALSPGSTITDPDGLQKVADRLTEGLGL